MILALNECLESVLYMLALAIKNKKIVGEKVSIIKELSFSLGKPNLLKVENAKTWAFIVLDSWLFL